jgi:hypothetical protein
MDGMYMEWVLAAGALLLVLRYVVTGSKQGGRSFRLGTAADPATRQLQIRVDGLLAGLKRQLSLEESPHASASMAAASGAIDGLFTKVHFGATSAADGTWLVHVEVELPGALPLETSVSAEGVASAVQQRLAGPDFQVGDPDADQLLRLDGHPADLAAVLSEDVIEELSDLVAYGGSVGGGRLKATLIPDPEWGYDLEELVRWIRLARCLSLRVGERPARLVEHLAPDVPAALRLASAEGLVDHHLNRPETASAEHALTALLHDPSQDTAHRDRAAATLARLRASRGLSGNAGGLAVVDGADGGELALSAQPGQLSVTKD